MGVMRIRLINGLLLAEEECKDERGLPFIPAYILRGALCHVALCADEITLTHARIAHYDAICSMLDDMEHPEAVFEPFVFSHFYDESGLKEGLVFEAHIDAPEKLMDEMQNASRAIRELLGADDMPLGRVEIEVDPKKEYLHVPESWHAPWYMNKEYSSLSYTLQVRSGLYFATPYDSKSGTRSYVEGGWMRQAILRGLGEHAQSFLSEGEIICSHAFPVIAGKRSMPSPYSFATRKLDRTDLHDRVSDGKRPDDTDQLVGMRGGFVDDVGAQDVMISGVDKRRAHVGPSSFVDVICEGQRFSGIIRGTTHQLRKVYELMVRRPIFMVGDLTQKGCGEVICHVDELNQDPPTAPRPLARFDIYCLSPVTLMNKYGLSDCSTQAFVKELEYWLKASDNLEAEKVFREITLINSTDPYWRKNGAHTQCIDQGSVYRIRTKDGTSVDVSPLANAKLGEDTPEGYGDVLVTRAIDNYYRKCESVAQEKHSLKLPHSQEALKESSKLRGKLLYDCMLGAIDVIGRIDTADCEDYNTILIPMELLELQAARYEQHVPKNLLRKWYLDSLLAEIGLLNPEQEAI